MDWQWWAATSTGDSHWALLHSRDHPALPCSGGHLTILCTNTPMHHQPPTTTPMHYHTLYTNSLCCGWPMLWCALIHCSETVKTRIHFLIIMWAYTVWLLREKMRKYKIEVHFVSIRMLCAFLGGGNWILFLLKKTLLRERVLVTSNQNKAKHTIIHDWQTCTKIYNTGT